MFYLQFEAKQFDLNAIQTQFLPRVQIWNEMVTFMVMKHLKRKFQNKNSLGSIKDEELGDLINSNVSNTISFDVNVDGFFTIASVVAHFLRAMVNGFDLDHILTDEARRRANELGLQIILPMFDHNKLKSCKDVHYIYHDKIEMELADLKIDLNKAIQSSLNEQSIWTINSKQVEFIAYEYRMLEGKVYREFQDKMAKNHEILFTFEHPISLVNTIVALTIEEMKRNSAAKGKKKDKNYLTIPTEYELNFHYKEDILAVLGALKTMKYNREMKSNPSVYIVWKKLYQITSTLIMEQILQQQKHESHEHGSVKQSTIELNKDALKHTNLVSNSKTSHSRLGKLFRRASTGSLRK